jgi:hypothetical protein
LNIIWLNAQPSSQSVFVIVKTIFLESLAGPDGFSKPRKGNNRVTSSRRRPLSDGQKRSRTATKFRTMKKNSSIWSPLSSAIANTSPEIQPDEPVIEPW